MLYPWVTRYPPDTRRARGRVRNFTRCPCWGGHGYALPAPNPPHCHPYMDGGGAMEEKHGVELAPAARGLAPSATPLLCADVGALPPRRQSLSTRTLPLPLRRGARHKDGGTGEPPTAAGARRRRGLRQHYSSLVGHNLLGNLCKGLVASLCSHTLVVWYGS
jgi:hypothetical protein